MTKLYSLPDGPDKVSEQDLIDFKEKKILNGISCALKSDCGCIFNITIIPAYCRHISWEI